MIPLCGTPSENLQYRNVRERKERKIVSKLFCVIFLENVLDEWRMQWNSCQVMPIPAADLRSQETPWLFLWLDMKLYVNILVRNSTNLNRIYITVNKLEFLFAHITGFYKLGRCLGLRKLCALCTALHTRGREHICHFYVFSCACSSMNHKFTNKQTNKLTNWLTLSSL